MYKKNKLLTNRLKGVDSFEGLSLEKEMEQATATQQPIDRATIGQIFYTQRKDGVLPECDIRTDKWEIALQAQEHINKDFKNRIKEKLKEKQTEEKQTETKTE